MRRLFDILEQYFNAPVVIAGSPKIDCKQNTTLFGTRKVYTKKTAELIRDCKLVVTHASTADNFAVLWGKPLLLITTNQFESSPQKYFLNAQSVFLDTPVINATNCLEGIDWGSLSQKPIAKYSDYKNRFIKKRGTPDINSWSINCWRTHNR